MDIIFKIGVVTLCIGFGVAMIGLVIIMVGAILADVL